MPTRSIETDADRKMLDTFLSRQKLPFTVTIEKGKLRSNKQNRYQRQLMIDIASQMGESAEYWRGYCKLHFGVGIVKASNEAFAEAYDRTVKGLPYGVKLDIMQEPLDLPVTRLMSTKQHAEYLDAIQRHFLQQGLELTDPQAFGLEAMKVRT